jgi:succinate dehydrogenase / fumarate reductase cytochrome b subunit
MGKSSGTNSDRPLSPHLQIYKPQITSVLSILHRMTGAALAVGTLMLVWLLLAAASGPAAYDMFMNFCASPLGIFMLAGWSFALYYHMCNGVRHLIWDTGYLFKIENARLGGWVVLASSLLLTALTWGFVYAG